MHSENVHNITPLAPADDRQATVLGLVTFFAFYVLAPHAEKVDSLVTLRHDA